MSEFWWYFRRSVAVFAVALVSQVLWFGVDLRTWPWVRAVSIATGAVLGIAVSWWWDWRKENRGASVPDRSG